MTEQEYIRIKEVAFVSSLINIATQITPEISDTITKEEYDIVISTLSKWYQKLLLKVNLKK